MTFARPAHNRHITFDEIAKKTGIPMNEVEILTMKAMSLGLLRGKIDQVKVMSAVIAMLVNARHKNQTGIANFKSKLFSHNVSPVSFIHQETSIGQRI